MGQRCEVCGGPTEQFFMCGGAYILVQCVECGAEVEILENVEEVC